MTVVNKRPIRIIALTSRGLELAKRLHTLLSSSELWFKPQPFGESVQKAFTGGDALIFICATGIVVRTLAPVIANKRDDPPVLVLDEAGQFVIPLLSGHEGGANDWAASVAQHIKAQLVITTAKSYLKPIYTVGMGCERHCPQDELERLLMVCLERADLTIDHIESINSIDLKSDEAGLIALAKQYKKPYQTFTVAQLSKVEDQLSVKSDYVFNTVGVYGVAESAALYSAIQRSIPHSRTAQDTEISKIKHGEAELLLTKQKTSKATCAIARSYSK